jgi:hypothetical protein
MDYNLGASPTTGWGGLWLRPLDPVAPIVPESEELAIDAASPPVANGAFTPLADPLETVGGLFDDLGRPTLTGGSGGNSLEPLDPVAPFGSDFGDDLPPPFDEQPIDAAGETPVADAEEASLASEAFAPMKALAKSFGVKLVLPAADTKDSFSFSGLTDERAPNDPLDPFRDSIDPFWGAQLAGLGDADMMSPLAAEFESALNLIDLDMLAPTPNDADGWIV